MYIKYIKEHNKIEKYISLKKVDTNMVWYQQALPLLV